MKRLTSRLLFLIQVSRPVVWPVLPLVYGLGLHAAQAKMTAIAVIQMLMLTFPMNLIGCGLNDIFDYESDRLSSRRRSVWGAVVSPERQSLVLRACLWMVPLVVFAACLTRNWDNIVATVSLVLIAWLYSVPPARFKERPPLDSIANGLGYFLLPLMMGYSLNASPRTMPARYYLLALCVCGIHALATTADYEADKAANHRTLAVAFGRRNAAALACLVFLLTWLLGDFQSMAVRVYVAVCAVAALAASLFPNNVVISTACVTIYVGFLVAAVGHIAGL